MLQIHSTTLKLTVQESERRKEQKIKMLELQQKERELDEQRRAPGLRKDILQPTKSTLPTNHSQLRDKTISNSAIEQPTSNFTFEEFDALPPFDPWDPKNIDLTSDLHYFSSSNIDANTAIEAALFEQSLQASTMNHTAPVNTERIEHPFLSTEINRNEQGSFKKNPFEPSDTVLPPYTIMSQLQSLHLEGSHTPPLPPKIYRAGMGSSPQAIHQNIVDNSNRPGDASSRPLVSSLPQSIPASSVTRPGLDSSPRIHNSTLFQGTPPRNSPSQSISTPPRLPSRPIHYQQSTVF